MTRVLVTGSSGFLGRQVALHLSCDPALDVLGFDIRPAPVGSFEALEGNLEDLSYVRRACRDVDVVVHFGGVGDVDLATEHPDLAARSNVVGTMNVALAAAAAGARVVYASTWEVYGPALADPVDEDHPCDPANAYAATKLAGEQMLRSMHRTDGLPVTVLRFGTAFGPGLRSNTVFRRFADAAGAGRPLALHGDGSQWRQFTHSRDIARAVRMSIRLDRPWFLANIASDERVTIRQLAEIVTGRYGVGLSFGPARAGEPPPARVSSARARRVLGWRAEVEFHDGLAELLESFETERAGELAAAAEVL
jgi:UDP-glucose 4-epimerase